MGPVALLRELFDAGVAAADAERLIAGALPAPPVGRTVVVGAGKAAAAMARGLERGSTRALEGLVVVPYGHGVACERVEVVEASHPLPDAAGEAAAERMLRLSAGLGADDLLVALFSGGGSSLLALPAFGVTLAEKRALSRGLLRSGASIAEINTVRKHLSRIKGGRLAAAAFPAGVWTAIVSDVPGDDPAVVASGPTVGDPTTAGDAQAVLERYGVAPSPRVLAHLRSPAAETPKPGDPGLPAAPPVVLATAHTALAAAADLARRRGYEVVQLGGAVEGEAREVAAGHARLVQRLVAQGSRRAVVLSGGETTVTVRGRGRGGRNGEYLLALAVELDGLSGVWALAADTDGIDGVGANAGAVATPDTLARAAAQGLDARAMLDDNDAGTFFELLGDLVVTGPTRTNVNDFRAILVATREGRARADRVASDGERVRRPTERGPRGGPRRQGDARAR